MLNVNEQLRKTQNINEFLNFYYFTKMFLLYLEGIKDKLKFLTVFHLKFMDRDIFCKKDPLCTMLI